MAKDELDLMNENMDRAMNRRENLESLVVKLLLLGPGESGKSTIFKQLSQRYLNHYDAEGKRMIYRSAINLNIVECLQELIPELDLERVDEDLQSLLDQILSINKREPLTPEVAALLEEAWSLSIMKDAYYTYGTAVHIPSGTDYFLDKISVVAEPEYIPSYDDVLRCRMKTSGIQECRFIDPENPEFMLHLVDVGGQKNERRKWLDCFENVASVLFVAALSEYDQVMYEDGTMNRLHDALETFGQVNNMECFLQTPVVLFLNKRDLFYEKYNEDAFRNCFADFPGGDAESASQFVVTKFSQEIPKDADKSLFVHITCATDASNIEFVFSSVKIAILSELTSGLL